MHLIFSRKNVLNYLSMMQLQHCVIERRARSGLIYQEIKMFHQAMFFYPKLFSYNTQETYSFDTSCYFVIYQQFLC